MESYESTRPAQHERCTTIMVGSTMLLSENVPHSGRDEEDFFEAILQIKGLLRCHIIFCETSWFRWQKWETFRMQKSAEKDWENTREIPNMELHGLWTKSRVTNLESQTEKKKVHFVTLVDVWYIVQRGVENQYYRCIQEGCSEGTW